jgi:hypothetical protein
VELDHEDVDQEKIVASKKKNEFYFSYLSQSILTAVVACGEIHGFVVCGMEIPADVGGEISLFVDDILSIDAPIESEIKRK